MNKAREYFNKSLRTMAVIYIPTLMVIAIFAIVLPFNIPAERLPLLIRPLWNTYGLLFGLGIICILILRITPFGRNYQKHVPLIKAVKAYDRTISQYERWQKKRNLQALINANECLRTSYEQLKEVPEYAELRQKVMRDYQLHFGGNNNSDENMF